MSISKPSTSKSNARRNPATVRGGTKSSAAAKSSPPASPAGGKHALRQMRRLLDIMARLRDPEKGCPWDLEQTIDSLKSNLLEEAYETLDAMETGDRTHLAEELGDLLLQIVFQARIAEEEGSFDFSDVEKGIADKLVRRHPHIFGNARADTPQEVLKNWEAIKLTENGATRRSALDGVPRSSPPLHRALQLQKRAARVGFDWQDANGALEKLQEETAELRRALRSKKRPQVIDELGDTLFTIVNICRHAKCDPAFVLERANKKFDRRFRTAEEEIIRSGRRLKDCTPDALDAAWNYAKKQERKRK